MVTLACAGEGWAGGGGVRYLVSSEVAYPAPQVVSDVCRGVKQTQVTQRSPYSRILHRLHL
jgi:hypothetical protein